MATAVHKTRRVNFGSTSGLRTKQLLDANNNAVEVSDLVTIAGAGSGAITPVGVASTGRDTTTDGVASGIAKVIGGRAAVGSADSASLTASNTETVLASVSIPANTIKQGSLVRVKFGIDVTANNSTTTLTTRVRLGPTTLTGSVLGSNVYDSAADDIVVGDVSLIAYDVPGATAACRAIGAIGGAAGGTGTQKVTGLGTGAAGGTIATNGALLLEVTGQWSANDANACKLVFFVVEII